MKREVQTLRRALDKYGFLLVHDAQLPSLTAIIAGEPVQGSWWGHPKGGLMYNALNALLDEPDVLAVKLINKKLTLLTKPLWPALIAAGLNADSGKLKADEKNLLALVERHGELRADDKRLKMKPAEAGKLASKLEERLLIYSEQLHTDGGKHIRVLKTWARLAGERKITPGQLSAEDARAQLTALLKGKPAKLPWPAR